MVSGLVVPDEVALANVPGSCRLRDSRTRAEVRLPKAVTRMLPEPSAAPVLAVPQWIERWILRWISLWITLWISFGSELGGPD